MTPDSSRFWPAKPTRRAALSRRSTSNVRDWCLATGWDRTAPGPELGGCRRGDEARYVEAFVLLTEIPFDRYLDDPAVVL
jgi:phosphoribosylaminoimidazole-succinocarboxamide synthase